MADEMIKKFLILIFLALIILPGFAFASDNICVTYFSGIGCPHCAKVDPHILGNWLTAYPNLVVIDYEIVQQNQNAYLLDKYNEKYHSGFNYPVLVISESKVMIGDSPILAEAPLFLNSSSGNPCPLASGPESFNETRLSELPGYPKIWSGNKVLIKNGAGGNSSLMKKLLSDCDIASALNGTNYQTILPEPVAISGGSISFEHAVSLGSWIFQWNGTGAGEGNGTGSCDDIKPEKDQLTWAKILALAFFDSINPCELAVLMLVLISVLTYNPNKKNMLYTGLAFVLAIFIIYLIYGLFIIKFFQVVSVLTSVRLILYKALAVVAIIIGLLSIKDYIWYKPGGWLTEMPVSLRPKAKMLIESITSPKGAMLLGAFVTLFLLPCTAGPYIIAGGLLSPLEILATLPYLLVYNIIFIIPMLVIVFAAYFGFAKPNQALEWKKRNVRRLHLISGLIILALGIVMWLGWV